MIVLQVILGVIVFSLPLWTGFVFRRKTIAESYLYGQVFLWAVFQAMAVPMIHLRLSFTALWITYTVFLAGMAGWGILRFRKRERVSLKPKKPWTQYLPLMIACLVILGQVCIYIFGVHLDEDDARWIAEANDALVKDKMYLHNPATGEYIGRFVGEMVKDVFSPWGMYVAVLSRLTMIPAAVIAHTVYAPILLVTAYIVYYRIGQLLFKGTMERGLFLLMVSLIMMFMGGNVYTQAVFTLTRIWQGKAVVAAVMIPLFLMLLLEVEHDDVPGNWLWLAAAGCACCLFSGMGIAISVILIAVYGGYAVLCKRFRRIPYLVLALLPSLLFGFFYLRMKG